jgi:hypothetical protein
MPSRFEKSYIQYRYFKVGLRAKAKTKAKAKAKAKALQLYMQITFTGN